MVNVNIMLEKTEGTDGVSLINQSTAYVHHCNVNILSRQFIIPDGEIQLLIGRIWKQSDPDFIWRAGWHTAALTFK